MQKWNCPEEYYFNCKNQLKKCKSCIAGHGSQQHHYDPIDSELTPHPHTKDRKRQHTLKRAKETEKRIEKEIARGTIRSGALNGDGDLHLLKGLIRVEAKDRGPRASWNLTWKEFDKGRRQGVDVYAISIEGPDKRPRTLYMMEDHIFNEWLALIKSNQD